MLVRGTSTAVPRDVSLDLVSLHVFVRAHKSSTSLDRRHEAHTALRRRLCDIAE